MDYLNLNNQDLQEIMFDMSEINKLVQEKQDTYQSELNIRTNRLGHYKLEMERRGSIYYTKWQSEFRQNTIINSTERTSCLSLYFVKKGESYYTNKKNENVYLAPNSSSVLFVQEDFNECSILKKDVDLETHNLILPLDYFKKLVHFYPDIFLESFRRFENGESFCINSSFGVITPEMNHILTQIENASLMGNCIEPYVDAKVLELLCLQFQGTNTSLMTQTSKDEDKIREASHILTSDIHNPPSIRELSLQVGINEKKLKQGFKSIFKTTVYGYLFDYKMQLAQKLLLDTNQTVSEIAFKCGYNYTSHFCTAFKRKFGTSPRKNSYHIL